MLLVFVLISFFIINKDITLAKRTGLYIRLILQSSVCFLIISLPAIISFIPFFQSVYRGGGVTIDSALSNSLAPINLISFVTPWPTLNATWHQYTDPLIRNCYPGFVLLLFFIYKITNTRKKSNLEWFLIGTIIFFILFSLGEYGGLRVLSFQYLPLMDTFRHPANSKIFFIFSIQLLSAFAINEFLNSSNFENNRFNKIIKIFLLLISIIFIISIYKSNILNIIPSIINNDVPVNTIIIKQIKDNLSFYDLLFLNSLLLLITALLIYFLHKKGILRKFLLPITLSEMAIVVQAMLPLTYVKNLEPAEIQKIINNQPKGYPIPENTISIAEQSIEGNRYFNILGSLNLYNKKPGRVDYVVTPSNLIDQENFWKNKALRDRIIKYPLCYFADTTFNAKDTLAFINFNSDKKAAIIDNINLPTGFGYEGKRNIVIKKFVPGKVYIQASNPSKSLLVFQQNYYYKWDAYVNGKKAKLVKLISHLWLLSYRKGQIKSNLHTTLLTLQSLD
ncbi:MAG: hypothetical protein IPM85_07530 [Chitinophagaceae bacterium]|nr:hypothetical protein [Chitinophagaceae bacterium]